MTPAQQEARRQFLGASDVAAVDDCTQCADWMHVGCVDPESKRDVMSDDTTPCERGAFHLRRPLSFSPQHAGDAGRSTDRRLDCRRDAESQR